MSDSNTQARLMALETIVSILLAQDFSERYGTEAEFQLKQFRALTWDWSMPASQLNLLSPEDAMKVQAELRTALDNLFQAAATSLK
jgi:hypothetical protein